MGHGKHTIHNQLHDQKRHETALSIVHEVPIAHPFLCFSANYTILGILPPGREERFLCIGAEVIEQVLDDNTRFSQHNGLLVWSGIRGLDSQERRLS